MTDMFHLKAIELICQRICAALWTTQPRAARAWRLAQYMAGMGFSNVGLGIVHSMAHASGCAV